MKKSAKRALIAYPGAKNTLAPKYERYYPPHRHFISPFGGSAAEFIHKAPSPIETWNDKDDYLFDMFKVLQNERQYDQLVKLLANTPNGRQQYLECRALLDEPRKSNTRVRRVWAFLVCAAIGFQGPYYIRVRSWSDNVGVCGRATKRLLDLPATLETWKDRFRAVRLEHLEWYTLFERYDAPSTFWFLDPPYHPATLHRDGLYSHLLTIKEHEKLLQVARNARGFVLLCGYDHPLYTSYLFHWRSIRFRSRARMGKHKPRQEVIWLNYEDDAHKVSGDKLLIAKRYIDITGGAKPARRYLDRIASLLALPREQQMAGISRHSRQFWRKIDDDGRANASTKLQIARHFVQLMGSVRSAQTYLDRVERLRKLFR